MTVPQFNRDEGSIVFLLDTKVGPAVIKFGIGKEFVYASSKGAGFNYRGRSYVGKIFLKPLELEDEPSGRYRPAWDHAGELKRANGEIGAGSRIYTAIGDMVAEALAAHLMTNPGLLAEAERAKTEHTAEELAAKIRQADRELSDMHVEYYRLTSGERPVTLTHYLARFAKQAVLQERSAREANDMRGASLHFWRAGAYTHALGAAVLDRQGVRYYTPDQARAEGRRYLVEHDSEIRV